MGEREEQEPSLPAVNNTRGAPWGSVSLLSPTLKPNLGLGHRTQTIGPLAPWKERERGGAVWACLALPASPRHTGRSELHQVTKTNRTIGQTRRERGGERGRERERERQREREREKQRERGREGERQRERGGERNLCPSVKTFLTSSDS